MCVKLGILFKANMAYQYTVIKLIKNNHINKENVTLKIMSKSN